MMPRSADVAILGAGPTGCALGAYLARRGHKIVLIEEIERPEGVVGESMLPCSTLVFEELGFDTSGFQVKHGAVFADERGSVRFDFAEAEEPRWTSTWQVQREVFDLRWREVARREGCEIVYAKATDAAPGRVETTAGTVLAGRVVDAAGRNMWLSEKLGLRRLDPRMRNAAVGTRMRGVKQVGLDQPGDITICTIPGGWLWIIPFGGGVASVGTVMSPACPIRGNAEERLRTAISLSEAAQVRLADAERILPLRGLQDFTASSTAFYGDWFALCGDAATFIDPVFSSGVLLGLHGARQLAKALDGGDLAAWEAEYREGAGIFRRVIDCWYAGEFMTVALAPAHLQKPYFRKGIVSLLAGDVYNPERSSPRRMAARMSDIAGRLGHAVGLGGVSPDATMLPPVAPTA